MAGKSNSLMVRLDDEAKSLVTQAADLRRVSVSDYVRMVMLAQAKREVQAAEAQTIAMTADEQLAFWKALSRRPKLTPAQKRLGSIMRGET